MVGRYNDSIYGPLVLGEMGQEGAFWMPVLKSMGTVIVQPQRLPCSRKRKWFPEVGAVLVERILIHLLQEIQDMWFVASYGRVSVGERGDYRMNARMRVAWSGQCERLAPSAVAR